MLATVENGISESLPATGATNKTAIVRQIKQVWMYEKYVSVNGSLCKLLILYFGSLLICIV